MKINIEGTYTLQYTAVDACGNETVEEREVEVYSVRTVLYNDGTFIINEKSTHKNANIIAHGGEKTAYAPMLEDGSNYVFTSDSRRPWNAAAPLIKKVEVDDVIYPTSMAFWFTNAEQLTEVEWGKIDTSNVTSMASLFYNCKALTTARFDSFDTSKVTNMKDMFNRCKALTTLDLSNFDTSSVTNMSYMFQTCTALANLDVSKFDTSNATTMEEMFSGCGALVTLDLSSFDTSKATNMYRMFYSDKRLETIFASDKFVVADGSNSSYMFGSMRNIVGGAGTVWREGNANNGTYAHIDGGTANPGYFTAKP